MGKLWFGGKIYTMQLEGDMAEALYTENGKIIDLGDKSNLEATYKQRITERIDLKGKTMLPGFVDSHMHLIGHGESLIRLDLSECTSKNQVFEALVRYAELLKDKEWIIGEGWNENLWDNQEIIHRKELDLLLPNRPVILKRVCRHALASNTAALERAGILSSAVVCPPGGVIERDENGTPTGILKDQAQDLLLSAVPDVSEEYLKTALRSAIKSSYKLGLTGVHTEDMNYYGSFSQTYGAFHKVIEEEGYRFRAHLLIHHEVAHQIESVKETNASSAWLEFGPVKIFADGALGGRTALLSHPYADAPETHGVAIYTLAQLKALVGKARSLGRAVAIHTIGDLAFEYALDAIEANPLKGNLRDRLIHAQILRKDLIDRAKQLPIVLDIQPRFTATDFPWVIDRIGRDNMEFCYAWKTLLDEGVPCAGGSDAPIEPVNPLLGIHAAVTRTNLSDPDKIAYYIDQALTVYEAVSLFTKGSAYAASHENFRGQIKPGFDADFTIFYDDIFETAPDDLADLKVAKTVIGESTVYDGDN